MTTFESSEIYNCMKNIFKTESQKKKSKQKTQKNKIGQNNDESFQR